MIEHSISALRNYGVTDIVIGTGYEADYFKDLASQYGLILKHNPNFSTTGSLKTLEIASEDVDEDVLILDSDILYDHNGIEALLKDERPNLVLVGSAEGQKDGAYVQTTTTGRIVLISKDCAEVPDACGILVGIAKLSKQALAEVKDYSKTAKNPTEHHDWAYFKVDSDFYALTSNLIFTEIDDDDQLSFAVANIYPKVRLCLLTTSKL